MKYRFLRFPHGKAKAVTLSYDDGCKADEKLIEILNKYGVKTTLNICSGWIEDEAPNAYRTVSNIKRLAESGNHEIAIHGDNHIAIGNTSTVFGINDILKCREKLEKLFGGIIRGMAYADTGINQLTAGVTATDIKQYLKYLGISYARTLDGGNSSFDIPQDFLEWVPTAHHNNPNLFEYLDDFLAVDADKQYSALRKPLLFYLWGHSSEYDKNNNWEILEEFCKKVSQYNDIWLATNIEVCDYVNAYRNLLFSVDNMTVFNPTAMDVWFDIDGQLYCVRAGQSLII